MKRTRHSGEGHGAHEYRHILVKTEDRRTKESVFDVLNSHGTRKYNIIFSFCKE